MLRSVKIRDVGTLEFGTANSCAQNVSVGARVQALWLTEFCNVFLIFALRSRKARFWLNWYGVTYPSGGTFAWTFKSPSQAYYIHPIPQAYSYTDYDTR